jgi:hypothetical protein
MLPLTRHLTHEHCPVKGNIFIDKQQYGSYFYYVVVTL